MIKFSRKYFFICLVVLFLLYALVFCVLFEKNYKAKHGYSFFFGKRPLISVLVTSYNYEQFLRKTLDSILDQTYKKYEVIIVDDGSTDNSIELINEYTHRYPNFHLYQHEGGINKGFPVSVKFGVEKVKGEYVAFLESDDYWRKDKLEEVVKMINKYPDAVFISNGVFPFTDDYDFNMLQTRVYLKDIMGLLEEKNTNILDTNNLLYSTIPTLSAVVMKKSVLINLDFNTPNAPFLDIWLYYQLIYKYPLYHIKKNLTFWRRHANSLSNRLNENYNGIFIENEFKKLINKTLSHQANSVTDKQ